MIVDEMHAKHPRLVKDIYWDELEPQLPYTKSSFMLRTQPHLGSAVNLEYVNYLFLFQLCPKVIKFNVLKSIHVSEFSFCFLKLKLCYSV